MALKLEVRKYTQTWQEVTALASVRIIDFGKLYIHYLASH